MLWPRWCCAADTRSRADVQLLCPAHSRTGPSGVRCGPHPRRDDEPRRSRCRGHPHDGLACARPAPRRHRSLGLLREPAGRLTAAEQSIDRLTAQLQQVRARIHALELEPAIRASQQDAWRPNTTPGRTTRACSTCRANAPGGRATRTDHNRNQDQASASNISGANPRASTGSDQAEGSAADRSRRTGR
jgi:hypothetical protein